MPMIFWVVPYVIAGGVMWLVAYQMAPVGREIPLSHGIIAVFLMGVCGAVSNIYLKSMLGNWRILAEFGAHALVVMAMFQLSLSRSLLAVLTYWAVMLVAIVIISILAKTQKRSLTQERLFQPAQQVAMLMCPQHTRQAAHGHEPRDGIS